MRRIDHNDTENYYNIVTDGIENSSRILAKENSAFTPTTIRTEQVSSTITNVYVYSPTNQSQLVENQRLQTQVDHLRQELANSQNQKAEIGRLKNELAIALDQRNVNAYNNKALQHKNMNLQNQLTSSANENTNLRLEIAKVRRENAELKNSQPTLISQNTSPQARVKRQSTVRFIGGIENTSLPADAKINNSTLHMTNEISNAQR